MVTSEGRAVPVSLFSLGYEIHFNTGFRALLSAAEGLRWPMPVDYASAKPELRKAFEGAFGNLLRLQQMYVPQFLSSRRPG